MSQKDQHSHEEEVLRKAVSGEKAALACLVNKYKDLAYTVAIRIVPTCEDAEEVVQDAFVKAFGALADFKKASKFSTWLYTIVYHTALTRIRNKKIPTASLQECQEQVKGKSMPAVAWDTLRTQERKQYIHAALNTLKKEDRLVVTLYYTGEKSVAEIADITGHKHSAIKMRLLRARNQLKAKLVHILGDETKDLL